VTTSAATPATAADADLTDTEDLGLTPSQITGRAAPASTADGEDHVSNHSSQMEEAFYDGPLDDDFADDPEDLVAEEALLRAEIAAATAAGRAWAAGEETTPEIFTYQGIGDGDGWPSPDYLDM
jgi:hypothetical protein